MASGRSKQRNKLLESKLFGDGFADGDLKENEAWNSKAYLNICMSRLK